MASDKDFFEGDPTLQGILQDHEIELYDEAKALLKKSKDEFLTWHEMMKLPHEENNYLIDKFLWEGQVCMLLAKEKVGKSILSKQMICALTSGELFLDEYDVSKECVVCYLQLEGDRGETKTRFKSMSQGVKVGAENFFWRFYDRLKLNNDADADKLIQELYGLPKRPDVIFLDPVYMCIKGSLSNDDVVSDMIGNIRKIQEIFNCSIVLVHHEHKPVKNKDSKVIDEGDDAIMGSFAFKAFVSHVIRMIKRPDGTRVLRCDTQRNGGVESEIKLTLNEEPLMFKKQKKKIPQGAGEEIYGFIKRRKEGASAQMVIESLGTPASTVRHCFGDLVKANKIRKSHRGDRGQVFYVAMKGE